MSTKTHAEGELRVKADGTPWVRMGWVGGHHVKCKQIWSAKAGGFTNVPLFPIAAARRRIDSERAPAAPAAAPAAPNPLDPVGLYALVNSQHQSSDEDDAR